ncbi:hypothetical protein OPS25_02145 [Alteromonas ponticola]|uniref:Uncharacterized protein n=1 Tax=Alteromonas aquimaris TaxID=2998417 RepID=A0ABT3P3G6_9ALTE|nr:hypothetical protein [Alteromonas aquimaris]MCW8107305.1 hypothetical protein [Alteromonas aquimaris]
MDKRLKSRLLIVRGKSGSDIDKIKTNLSENLQRSGIKVFHIGTWGVEAYAVIGNVANSASIVSVTKSSDVEFKSLRYLQVENAWPSGDESAFIANTFSAHPINYGVQVPNKTGDLIGICGLCGGVSAHIGPPCKSV